MPVPTKVRIQQLITESGLTQAEFAHNAGLDASKFSKSMNGVRRFTSLDLARIAEKSGVTVDWLLGIDKPVPALAARSREVTSSEQEAITEARRLAQLWSDLEFLGYSQPRVILDNVQLRGRNIDQGHQLAEHALEYGKNHGHKPWETLDLVALVEETFGIDVRVMPFAHGYEGLCWRDDTCSLMVIGASDIPARQRFTIAHELGHLLAADDQGLHLDANLNDSTHRRQPSEMRANAFATEFLMPAKVIKEKASNLEWTDREFALLACDLFVSPVSLAWRLFNLRLIDNELCARFRTFTGLQAAHVAGRLDEHWRQISSAAQPRLPTPLVGFTYLAYKRGDMTLRPLANLIGVDTDYLRRAMDGAREEIPLSS